MKSSINILLLGVTRTKAGQAILNYAIADLKESTNRKGYNLAQMWFDNDSMFNKIKNTDIGKVVKADVTFVPTNNGQAKMKIENVYC